MDTVTSPPASNAAGTEKDFAGAIQISDKFAIMNHLILRDLNDNPRAKSFFKFKKDDIAGYLANPQKNEKALRNAIIYLYGASPHFRRLIHYFVGLSDLAYIVEPYRIDPKKANEKTTNLNYRRVLNVLSSMRIKTQFPKILTVCFREDVFYGTFWVTNDNITIQQLPSDYCQISSIEGNVMNVTFDFSYFTSRRKLLAFYPPEFSRRFDIYLDNRKMRWQELDCPTSFAVKFSTDIPDYALPPFAGILREIYELEDYKELKLSKTALENYALLAMTLPLEEGEWGIDLDKAIGFWQNLEEVLPEEVGSVLTPMKIDKIDFEKSNVGDTNTIADAEQSLFSAAGVSSLLFNNAKASANALLLSIKADQSLTFSLVKNIEDVVNRFIQAQSYGKNFTVNFLDVSPYNRKEAGGAYLKAASYGLPTVSAYAASQGIGQAELDAMSYLEGRVLKLQDLFRPVVSSSQLNKDALDKAGATDEGGAPEKDMDELTESGEQNREDA